MKGSDCGESIEFPHSRFMVYSLLLLQLSVFYCTNGTIVVHQIVDEACVNFASKLRDYSSLYPVSRSSNLGTGRDNARRNASLHYHARIASYLPCRDHTRRQHSVGGLLTTRALALP